MFTFTTLPYWVSAATGDGDNGGDAGGSTTPPAGDPNGQTPGTSGDTDPEKPKAPKPGEEVPKFTQADLDRHISERLARERAKLEGLDVDDLKAKASQWDAAQGQLTDLQKAQADLDAATRRAETAEAKLAERQAADELAELVATVAEAEKVPAALLRGKDEAELKAHAKALKDAGLGTGQAGPRSSAFSRVNSATGPALPASKGVGTLRGAYSQ